MVTIIMVMALIDNGGDDDSDKRVVKAFFVAQIVPLRWNKRNARCCVYFVIPYFVTEFDDISLSLVGLCSFPLS